MMNSAQPIHLSHNKEKMYINNYKAELKQISQPALHREERQRERHTSSLQLSRGTHAETRGCTLSLW